MACDTKAGLSDDERAEPYAVIANQGRLLVRRHDPAKVHAWLHERMSAIAAAKGHRRISSADWAALALVLMAAVPDDVDWFRLTEWVRDGEARGNNRQQEDEAAQRRELVLRLSGEGLDRREIVAATGLSKRTVARAFTHLRAPGVQS